MSNKEKNLPVFPQMGVFALANRTIIGGVVKGIDVKDIPFALAPFLASHETRRTLECVLMEIEAMKRGKTDTSEQSLDYIARMAMQSLVRAGLSPQEIEKGLEADLQEIYGD